MLLLVCLLLLEVSSRGAATEEAILQPPTGQLAPPVRPESLAAEQKVHVEQLVAGSFSSPYSAPSDPRHAHGIVVVTQHLDRAPMWANHTTAQRTANLVRHHRHSRRRLQWNGGQGTWASSSDAARSSSVENVVNYNHTDVCADGMATNLGQAHPCHYDCETLRGEFFPEPQLQAIRCFVFDSSTGTWPEAGGAEDELLDMRGTYNTVTIPANENWIIHGGIDLSTGLPFLLDARLKSGTAIARSRASIVLRRVRISNQVAPADSNLIGRVGMYAGTGSYGGAFEYDGGGDDDERSNLPKLAFIDVVFDHNSASQGGGAVSIEGRAAQTGLDPSSQIWESGAAVTFQGCVFFRNYCETYAGALAIHDVWPLDGLIDSTDFVQNEGKLFLHDYYLWNTYTGPRKRAGITNLTLRDVYYEGGWTTEGISNVAGMTMVKISGTEAGEPDAILDIKFERCTWTDHAASFVQSFNTAIESFVNSRGESNGLRMYVSHEDTSILDAVGLGVNNLDSIYHMHSTTYSRFVRTRFIRNGNFNQAAAGEGGIWFRSPPSGVAAATADFEHTQWDGCAAALGPAIYAQLGMFEITLTSCVLANNIAYKYGGAIVVQGLRGSKLTVQLSDFIANAVQVPEENTGIDLIVMVNTGNVGIGTGDLDSGEYVAPMWRIESDSGVSSPVFGIGPELCAAAAANAEHQSATWQRNATCGNVSYYGPDRAYSEVVTLLPGWYSLWTGVVPMQSNTIAGWQQGWIEIKDVIGPLFPEPIETRANCIANSGCSARTGSENCCPKAIPMWSASRFRVASGTGGAILTNGPVAITVSDSVFQNNVAASGSCLSITAAERIRIAETTMMSLDNITSPVRVVATTIDTCIGNPCAIGHKCLFRDNSVFCTPCATNEIGLDGIQCSACPPGTEPEETKTRCVPCRVGAFSKLGICQECPTDRISVPDFTSCVACPADLIPNAVGDDCECNAGYYDSRLGQFACYDVGVDINPPDLIGQGSGNASVTCQPCDARCIECAHGVVTVKPGAAISEMQKEQLGDDEFHVRSPAAVFICPFETCLGHVNGSSASACAVGSSGALCGHCHSGFIRSELKCIECSSATGKSLMAGMLYCVALAAMFLGANKCNETFSDLMVPAKVLIGLLQITTELPSTLKLNYPPAFSAILEAMRVLLLDVFDVFSLGCISTISLHTEFIIVMLLPVVGLLAVQLLRLSSLWLASRQAESAETPDPVQFLRARQKSIGATASYRSFFILFILYPLLSRTTFRMFRCHHLEAFESWHPDDYRVDCGSPTHRRYVVAAGIFVGIYPVGVPLGFLWLLRRDQRRRNAGQHDSTCDFLRSDYRSETYFFEVVVLCEKLVMTGLLTFVDRGSVFQAFAGAIIVFLFCMLQSSMRPYQKDGDNRLKAVAEAQLFATLLVSIVLRTDLRNDALSAHGYGNILIVVLFATPTLQLFSTIVAPLKGLHVGRQDEHNGRVQCQNP